MSARLEADPATVILRLLLEENGAVPGPRSWHALMAVALRERVAARLGSALARRGVELPSHLAALVEESRIRSARMVELAAGISERASRHGIPHVFLKLAQHYPDSGSDLDVLVPAGVAIDPLLPEALRGPAPTRSLAGRLSGTTVVPAPEAGTAVDFHHGRLGMLGEHNLLAARVVRGRRMARLDDRQVVTPSPEDQMLLQSLALTRGWPELRLGEVAWVMRAIREGRLDWNPLRDGGQETGLRQALGSLLAAIDAIHRRVFRLPLLDPAVRRRFGVERAGPVRRRAGRYRFPLGTAVRLHWTHLRTGIRRGDWAAAGRLTLLPILAVAAAWRRLGGGAGLRGSPP